MKHTHLMVSLMVIGLTWTSCQKNEDLIESQISTVELTGDPVLTPFGDLQGEILTSVSNCTVAPIFVMGDNQGGNVSCSEVGEYDLSSGRINYDADINSFDAVFPEGFTVMVSDDKYVSWSYEDPNGVMCLDGVSVIVKGSNGAHVYTYASGCSASEGLKAPLNNGGQQSNLSNLTFCYNLIPCEAECVNREETGFGGNLPGAGKAWWFAFDTQGPAMQYIYAGKTKTDGTVTYANGMLTINLGSWSLQDVDQPVKIQGYNDLPTKRPAAGLFTTYKGSNLIIPVSGFRYYVIHLDLMICE